MKYLGWQASVEADEGPCLLGDMGIIKISTTIGEIHSGEDSMKLPRFFRSLMYFSLRVFLISLVLIIVLLAVFDTDLPGAQRTAANSVGGVVIISFLCMSGSIILDPLTRVTENALLRRFGRSATAEVLDLYYVESGTQRGFKLIEATRVKLEVHDPQGGSFIAVAEDGTRLGGRLSAGQTVPVKFDPRTHEVALDLPPRPKMKMGKDF
jgi:hypothetical protein